MRTLIVLFIILFSSQVFASDRQSLLHFGASSVASSICAKETGYYKTCGATVFTLGVLKEYTVDKKPSIEDISFNTGGMLLGLMIAKGTGPLDRHKFDGLDKTLLAASAITLIADAMQTVEISNNPKFIEKNKILGEKPSREAVVTYFAACIGATYIVSRYILKDRYRKMFLTAIPVMEFSSLRHNYMIGVRVGGSF